MFVIFLFTAILATSLVYAQTSSCTTGLASTQPFSYNNYNFYVTNKSLDAAPAWAKIQVNDSLGNMVITDTLNLGQTKTYNTNGFRFTLTAASILTSGGAYLRICPLYNLTVTEYGIPAGTNWGAMINGQYYQTSNTNMVINDLSETLTYRYDYSVPEGTGINYIPISSCTGTAEITTPNPGVSCTYSAQYLLTTVVYPSGSGAVYPVPIPGGIWYNTGSHVTISAIPNNGYTFTTWVGNGSDSYTGSKNPVSIIMNGPVTESAYMTASTTTSTTMTTSTTTISPVPSISVISPSGGEAWRVGYTYPIQWTLSGLDSTWTSNQSIQLQLWDNTGSNFIGTFCTSCFSGSKGGSYSWTIQDVFALGDKYVPIQAGKYTIRASVVSKSQSQYYPLAFSAPFTINSYACTDNGMNFYQKSSVTSSQGNVWWDQCIQFKDGIPSSSTSCSGSDCYLYEMLCQSPTTTSGQVTKTYDGIYSVQTNCANGCTDGACVGGVITPITSTVTSTSTLTSATTTAIPTITSTTSTITSTAIACSSGFVYSNTVGTCVKKATSFDPAKLLQIAFSLQNFKSQFDSLSTQAQQISDYYKSQGNMEKSNKWHSISQKFSSLSADVSKIVDYLISNKDNLNDSTLENARAMITDLNNNLNYLAIYTLEAVR